MIVYLSGPMSGLPEFNFPEFRRVAADLCAKGYEVINPADIDQPDKSWEACMRVDIKEMMKADALAMLKDWQKSAGAGLEVTIASALKMPILDAYTLEPIDLDVQVSVTEKEIPEVKV